MNPSRSKQILPQQKFLLSSIQCILYSTLRIEHCAWNSSSWKSKDLTGFIWLEGTQKHAILDELQLGCQKGRRMGISLVRARIGLQGRWE